MKQGDFEAEVVFEAAEVAELLKHVAISEGVVPMVLTIKVVSRDKTVMALNFDMRTSEFNSVSTAQATHWKGMDSK
jgi:hypothetical protein